MSDPFQDFISRKKTLPAPGTHGERKHSKFSASGAERWFKCPGSVALSEGVEDKSNKWAEEGTRAHEILEAIMRIELSGNCGATIEEFQHVLQFDKSLGFTFKQHQEMLYHAGKTAEFILKRGRKKDAVVLVETRIPLDFIHPEAFGTFDGAVLEYFGTLDVVDFKYGARHIVSPIKNLQMIFYGMALAHKYEWNFERVRLWIDQPRGEGYDGAVFWELSIDELKAWVDVFEDRVLNVELNPDEYIEGSWCHWCKAKKLCPLKREKKLAEAQSIFSQSPIDSGLVEEYE